MILKKLLKILNKFRIMNRQKEAQNINKQFQSFFKKNQEIENALKIFNISNEQYQKALESSYNFYTDISTSARDITRHYIKK